MTDMMSFFLLKPLLCFNNEFINLKQNSTGVCGKRSCLFYTFSILRRGKNPSAFSASSITASTSCSLKHCLYISLSVYSLIQLSLIFQFIYLSVDFLSRSCFLFQWYNLSIFPSTHSLILSFIPPSIHLLSYWLTDPSIDASIHLSIEKSIYPSNHSSIYVKLTRTLILNDKPQFSTMNRTQPNTTTQTNLELWMVPQLPIPLS